MDWFPLNVLLEDGPLLAVNKPAGLLTQGVPQGLPTLESQIRAYLKEKYQKPGNVYLGIPHRLDRPTSGVIVFARNSKAAARLAEQFHDRRVRKEYLAVVESPPSSSEGVLTDWLSKDAERAHTSVVDAGVTGAKIAELRYRVLETANRFALLHLEPRTGRMHQIRVQLASRGWPIVGDVQYGATTCLPESTETADAIALHAFRLSLLHPVRYDPVVIEAPLSSVWSAFGFEAASSKGVII